MATGLDEGRVRDILRVLCRIPLSSGQLGLYRLSVDAPEKGFTSTQIKALWKLDQAQHRGLMAAQTRRINETPRETQQDTKPGLGLLFSQQWNGQENTYRPRSELLEAIRRLPQLHDLMQRPIVDVVQEKRFAVTLPPGVPPTPAPKPIVSPTPAGQPFTTLIDALERADLVYPSELIANLLLALQVKRFVILTGISGTGKTRVAQVLADHFSVKRRVEHVVEGTNGDASAILRAHPDTVARRRFILPRALAMQMPVLQTHGPSSLRIEWPGGKGVAGIWQGNATSVRMPASLWTWFSANVPAGASYQVTLIGPEAAPDGIRLGPVADERVAVRVERVPNVQIVAVRPDWTDHRGLLGAYNPLTQQYMTTPFIKLLIIASEEATKAAAEKRPAAPFFLVLDEMNLARVEHYFADFLSALESGEPLHLHDSPEIEEGAAEPDGAAVPIPQELKIPPNLFFIGTVNVDESTYMFSPKVLDRAFALELNAVDLRGLVKGVQRGGELDLGKWSGRLDALAKPGRADWKWLASHEDGALVAEIEAFHRLLARHNRHFGYRVATEIARFVRLAFEQASQPGDATWAALDLALLQKVLVKLHGTRHELGSILDALLRFALVGGTGDEKASDLAAWIYAPEDGVVRRKDETAEMEAVFPRSAAKLWRMRDRLIETGFTSWIE